MASASSSSANRPPELPPRQSSTSDLSPSYSDAPPPPYQAITMEDNAGEMAYPKGPWSAQDPRSSSTQSLTPSEGNEQNERRKLLLIYIHGFMGNETSFRSFPAHVHHLLTVLVRETHVVHTKIYPRYQSRNKMFVARDNFSKWLEPHEDSTTDVVLLGHSMGGLLSAEVVLMPPPARAGRPLKHRILGTINFDVPFLGMHPGVVKSGLASIFKSDEPPEDQYSDLDGASATTLSPVSSQAGRSDTLWSPEQSDPNYNPSFNNDVVLPMRKGWQNAWHFVNKHSNDLFKATKNLVGSHMEFGGAMANYPELKARYGRVRALEEDDAKVRKSVFKTSQAPGRVRFVNYYTASTGRVKKATSPSRLSPSANGSQASLSPSHAEEISRGRSSGGVVRGEEAQSRSRSPRISLEEHSDGGVVQKVPDIPHDDDENANRDEDLEQAAESLTIQNRQDTNASVDSGNTSFSSTITAFPPIPDPPTAPPPLNVDFIQDPATRKLVEKEHARAVKSFERAVKDRDKALKDRAKLEEKREKKAQRDAEKAAKDAQRAKVRAEQDSQKAQKAVENAKEGKELTHSQKEELRLEGERKRMEAEGRRLRGEKSPEGEDDEEENEGVGEEAPYRPPSPMESISPSLAPEIQQLSSSASPSPSRSPSPINNNTSNHSDVAKKEDTAKKKEPKDRKFCLLPPKDSRGERDPAWIRVFMANVDEVGAHCGLFFIDERYERLVGEVAERVEGWVREEKA